MKPVLPALLLLCSTAHAVPGQFTHQGRLLDGDGVPLEGDTTITFRVTDSDSGGDELWEETLTVPVTNGFYSAVLGADEEGNPLDVEVLSQAPAWLELQLEGAPAMYPRTAIHSVPYATMATVAEEVSGGPVDASEVAVDGALVINDAGEWVGPAPTVNWADLEGVPAGFADGVDDDTDSDTDSFADLGVSCLDGDVPVWDEVAMAWACGDDVDTVLSEEAVDAMVADNGYAMSSEIFSGSFLDLSDVPEGLEDGDTTLSESEVDEMVSDDIAVLLDEIETLKDQVAALEEESEGSSGGVMYGDYSISNSVHLAALEGFTEVTGNLNISGVLPHLDGLESLTRVGGILRFYYTSEATDLSGLSNLEHIGGDLDLRSNDALTSLNGLDKLETIGGELSIEDNDALTSTEGFGSLTTVSGHLMIQQNNSLTELDGFDVLESIGGQLEIYNNPLTTDVSGMSNLETIGGRMKVHGNDALLSFSGLSSLESIGVILQISDNANLMSITGLHGLTSVGGNIYINRNTSLCNSSAATFISIMESSGWPHVADIGENADC